MAEKKKMPAAAEPVRKENRFLKEQLIASERFREKKDILNALLADGMEYTASEAEGLIEKYMKGKVK